MSNLFLVAVQNGRFLYEFSYAIQGRSWGEGEWCRPEGLSIRADKINIVQEKDQIFCAQ